jgi:regulator of PEP synthase PpsR (kinase-PPPase family)
VVLFTLVDPALRALLMDRCRQLQVPCIPVLDPVLSTLSGFFGRESRGQPGRQHVLDQEYFERIDAMQFALNHDDGQAVWNLEEADVVLVGVSRTSKTPTCIYLANRGFRTANVPIVPNCPVPPQLTQVKRPLIVGLTKDPMSLVQVRRHRVKLLHQDEDTDYTDPDVVREEVAWARKMFNQNGWPVIDVTRRSIEETAATIIRIHDERQAADDAADG